jgi:hypothetical protein
MIRECFSLNIGILFYKDSFKSIGLDPDTLDRIATDRPEPLKPLSSTVAELRAAAAKAQLTEDEEEPSSLATSTFQSEEDEELADIVSPAYDQLKKSRIRWFWWFIEYLYLRHHRWDRKNMARTPYWSYVLFSSHKVLLYSRSMSLICA